MIPNVFHRIWIDPINSMYDSQLPDELRPNIESWNRNEPFCFQRLWSLKKILALCWTLNLPDVARAILSCRFPSMQADIARLLILQAYGGYWVDIKLYLNRPFLSDLTNYDLIVTEHFAKDDFPNPNGHLSNSFIGAKAQQPVISETLKMVVENVNLRKQDSIYHITGATNLNTVFYSFQNISDFSSYIIPHQVAWGDIFEIKFGAYNGENMHWSLREKRESPYLD